MLTQEIWKDIDGYVGRYKISNFGNVKSVSRYDCRGHKRQEKVKVPRMGKYMSVTLYNDAGYKTYYVHKLVADAFIPNPDNLSEINHKDENKLNNCVDNLEWCTHSYNQKYGKGKRKTVLQFALDGKFICSYFSVKDASKRTGIPSGNIVNVCNKNEWTDKFGSIHRNITAGGYIWKYDI